MVAGQLRARGMRDERVLAAMGAIPREAFVPDEKPARSPTPTRPCPIDAGQTISQPFMVARMTELLAVQPGDRILEIGTGLRLPGGDPRLARCPGHLARASGRPHPEPPGSGSPRSTSPGVVTIREADGSLGDPAGAPWDGIIVTAAAPAIPDALREQLAEGGRLVIPVGPRDRQLLTVVDPPRRRLARARPTATASSSRSSARRASRADDPRPDRCGSVYSPGHDPCLRRAAPGRRRALVRRTHRQPPRARPDRHDPDRLLGRRDVRCDLTAYQREALGFGSKAMWPRDRGVQPERHRRRLADRRARPRLGGHRRPARRHPVRRRRRPPSASGSARRGIAGRASATSRWPTSRSSTTCRPRAPSTPTRSWMPPRPAT